MSDCQTCGTGSGTITYPSDPDNNISLSARTVYGGINVSWTWPTTNEQAVAQTIVYRGLTNNPVAMIELARVGGSIYFDSLEPTAETQYFYWIQLVTVNGTRLPKIGPVSAIAKVRGKETLESLTGLIDSSVLAQALKEDIAGINQVGADLIREIEDRIAANTELSGLLQQVQEGVTEAMTYINTEITQRIDGDSAIVNTLTTMAAAVQDNAALIFQESTVRANADEALAQQTTDLYARTSDNAAAIQQEITARTNADSAISTSVTTLTTRVGNAETTINNEATARSTADAALGRQISGVETSLNGNISTVQTQLSSQISTVNGKVTQIGALYTAKVQVNGLIGGFGIYNDGTSVSAGFDVDQFWVGRTGPDKVKPFIIDNGVVYIDKARIRNADIDTLKLAGNSVTVPYAQTFYGATFGNGLNNWITVASGSIYLPEAGVVYAASTAQLGYGQGWVPAQTRLLINGQVVSANGGEEAYITSAHSAGMYVGRGQVNVQLQFGGQDNKVRIDSPTLFIQGAMR